MPNHTFIALLRDKPGALHRAVTLFRRRSYNVASLRVERSDTPGLSRMTVSVDAHNPESVIKELERIVDVLSVHNVTHDAPTTTADLAPLSPLHSQADGVGDEDLSV